MCRKWGALHFRHVRAMHLYQAGMPLPLISQWLGHSRIETSLIYAYADAEMKRAAVNKAKSTGPTAPTIGKWLGELGQRV